jgi:hypothetical protein
MSLAFASRTCQRPLQWFFPCMLLCSCLSMPSDCVVRPDNGSMPMPIMVVQAANIEKERLQEAVYTLYDALPHSCKLRFGHLLTAPGSALQTLNEGAELAAPAVPAIGDDDYSVLSSPASAVCHPQRPLKSDASSALPCSSPGFVSDCGSGATSAGMALVSAHSGATHCATPSRCVMLGRSLGCLPHEPFCCQIHRSESGAARIWSFLCL